MHREVITDKMQQQETRAKSKQKRAMRNLFSIRSKNSALWNSPLLGI